MALSYRGNFNKKNYILDWKFFEREVKRKKMKSETNNQKTFSSFAIPLFRRKTVDAYKNHPAKKEKSFVINGQKTRAIES